MALFALGLASLPRQQTILFLSLPEFLPPITLGCSFRRFRATPASHLRPGRQQFWRIGARTAGPCVMAITAASITTPVDIDSLRMGRLEALSASCLCFADFVVARLMFDRAPYRFRPFYVIPVAQCQYFAAHLYFSRAYAAERCYA